MLRIIGLACVATVALSQDVAVADATGAPALDTSQSDAALASAKSVVDNVRANGNALMLKEQTLCKAEFDGVNEWQATIEGNAAQRAADKAQRDKDKKGLADAIGGRLAALEKFLVFLKTIRKQLGSHIQRTNKIFTSVYDANQQCVLEASKVMQDLGYVVSLPWSPFVTPIIVPKQDKQGTSSMQVLGTFILHPASCILDSHHTVWFDLAHRVLFSSYCLSPLFKILRPRPIRTHPTMWVPPVVKNRRPMPLAVRKEGMPPAARTMPHQLRLSWKWKAP
jgi:hypothetical protein